MLYLIISETAHTICFINLVMMHPQVNRINWATNGMDKSQYTRCVCMCVWFAATLPDRRTAIIEEYTVNRTGEDVGRERKRRIVDINIENER